MQWNSELSSDTRGQPCCEPSVSCARCSKARRGGGAPEPVKSTILKLWCDRKTQEHPLAFERRWKGSVLTQLGLRDQRLEQWQTGKLQSVLGAERCFWNTRWDLLFHTGSGSQQKSFLINFCQHQQLWLKIIKEVLFCCLQYCVIWKVLLVLPPVFSFAGQLRWFLK